MFVGKVVADNCIIIEIPEKDARELLEELDTYTDEIEEQMEEEGIPTLLSLRSSLRRVIEGE